MDIEIKQKNFINVKNLSQVKTYIYKIAEYHLENGSIIGKINIDIDYYDTSMVENFSSMPIDFSIMVADDLKVENVKISDFKIEVIENRGIDCYYELIVSCDLLKKEEVIEPINEYQEISKNESKINESQKLEIQENYDQMLQKSLENREEQVVEQDEYNREDSLDVEENISMIEKEQDSLDVEESISVIEKEQDCVSIDTQERNEGLEKSIGIITTKDTRSEFDFISFFDSLEESYKKIKTILISNEHELDEISKEYHIPLDEVYRNYDRETKKVIIRDE